MGMAVAQHGVGVGQQTESDFIGVGEMLRERRQKLNTLIQSPSYGKNAQLNQMVHELQQRYEGMRINYEFVYRAVYGNVPEGLAGAGLGVAIPLWVGGIIATILAAMKVWDMLFGKAQTLNQQITAQPGSTVSVGTFPEDTGFFGKNLKWWVLGGIGAIGAILVLRY